MLKKNSGVEVVQYSGVLSGIGIRGFRPETSGLNKRSLLLIDGRPSGVTNLSTLHARQRRAYRGAQGTRIGDLRRIGDGRSGQRHHAPVAGTRSRAAGA